MYQKFNELPNKAELNKSIKLHSKILGPCGKYTSRPLWFNSAIVQLKINWKISNLSVFWKDMNKNCGA